ncbi:MAG: Kelch repeat-containing protein [Polyangiales bacterium]
MRLVACALFGTLVLSHPGPSAVDRAAEVMQVLGSAALLDAGAPSDVRTQLPRRAGDRWWIGSDDRTWIELSPEIAAAAHAVHADGASVFLDAAPDTDVVFASVEGRVEELRVLRSPSAKTVSRARVRLGPAVAALRAHDDRIEAVDAQGAVVLHTLPAYAVDARGQRRRVSLSIESGDLVASLDAHGLAYPIAVDPAWTATSKMAAPRMWHAMAYFGGTPFVTGGLDAPGGAFLSTAERFFADTSSWGLTAKSMLEPRAYHVSLVLDADHLLVAGGKGPSGPLSTAEVFATPTWKSTAPLASEHNGGNGVALGGGKALMAGGFAVSTAEIYDAAADKWTPAGAMAAPRAQFALVPLASGKILALGGSISATMSAFSTAERFDPSTSTWAPIASMSTARAVPAAWALPSGKVLVAGGFAADGTILTSSEIYDPSADTWVAGPPMNGGTSQTASGDPVIMTVLGTTANVYDVASNTWKVGPMLPTYASGQVLVSFPDGRVMVAGGKSSAKATDAAAVYALANGESCPGAVPCSSGHCVDGVCCDTACTDQCSACDLAGALGKCGQVNGPTHGSRAACTPAASCTASTFTPASTCNGSGACATGTPQSCGNYGCDVTGCKTGCAGDADCAVGFVCAAKSCVPRPKGTCAADHASSNADNGTVTECAPYVCDDSTGTCKTGCGTSADCESGDLCDVTTKVCAPPPNADSGGGSGGCSLANRGSAGGWLLLALLALRRRRRADCQ